MFGRSQGSRPQSAQIRRDPIAYAEPPARPRPQTMAEAPPAYSPTAPRGSVRVPSTQTSQISSQSEQSYQPPAAPPTSPPTRSTVEDPLSALGRYDCVFLVDDSPSMSPLWEEARDALTGVVAKSVTYDKDGIDLFFMNAERALKSVTSPNDVSRLFQEIVPSGSTPTALRLDDIVRPYIEQCEDAKTAKTALPKPMILVVLTDGRADDEDMLADIIVEFAGRLDEIRAPPHQLGLQFLQIGDDPDAAEFLKQLDDGLKEEHKIRDLVDTRSFAGRMDADLLLRILLGSVNRRVDNQA